MSGYQALRCVTLFSTVAVLALSALTPQRGTAQTWPETQIGSDVVFAIAEVDSLPYGSSTPVIVRRTDKFPSDVILVTRGRFAESDLLAAVDLLRGLRATEGDTPRTNGLFRVDTRRARRSGVAEAARWMARMRQNHARRRRLGVRG